MRRNTTKNFTELPEYQLVKLIQSEYSELLSEEFIDGLARENGFVQRRGKVSASSFVKTLIFSEEDHSALSLLDLKCDILNHENCNVSREAIHKRFNEHAVSFLKALVSKMISIQLDHRARYFPSSCFFEGIYLKDSSKFKLPIHYVDSYPNFGGYDKASALMNIQYEYELLSKSWGRLELTKATRNDQAESKETVGEIKAGGLYIRDLGYITTTYLNAVEEKGAFYLKRLSKIGVHQKKNGKYKPLNWQALDKKIKKGGLRFLELEVYLGEEKIKTRLILTPVPEEIANERVRKAKQGGKRKSKGYQISKEYKIKARYNIYITNVAEEILSTDQVIEGYKLRWQIELNFKAWKSNLNIHKIKKMKKERMECQLLAKFIWILLNTKILQASNYILKKSRQDKVCSCFKFFKRAKGFSNGLRYAIFDKDAFANWFESNILKIIPYLVVEKRLAKPPHNQVIDQLFTLN